MTSLACAIASGYAALLVARLAAGATVVSLEDAPGRMRVNGHSHVPALDGNRVQVGTFTGGGTLAHFVGGPDAELVGQASSFDVLTFDEECRAQRLVRYQYRAIIEGRPSFDSLSVLNASRIVEPPEEGRTCGGDELEVRPLGE